MSNTPNQSNDENIKPPLNTEKLNPESTTEKPIVPLVSQTSVGKLGRGLGRLIPIKNSQDNTVKTVVSGTISSTPVTRVPIQSGLSKSIVTPDKVRGPHTQRMRSAIRQVACVTECPLPSFCRGLV